MNPKIEWTDEMLAYLRANVGKKSQMEMGLFLGYSASAIGMKLQEMGLGTGRGGNKRLFSESQMEYIKTHYADEPTCDIAEHLGCSTGPINRVAAELGLKKSESFNRFGYAGRLVRNYTYGSYNKDYMKPKSA